MSKKTNRILNMIIGKDKKKLAESTEEAEKDIEVNKGSFNAKKDVREQIWDSLGIK